MECTEKECLFCKIVKKEIPAEIVYEDEIILSFLDIDPINEGHLLIIPKKHYLDLDELDEATAVHIMKFSIKATRALKKVFQPEGYSIMQNGGHFNDIGHYHMHIFPRYKSDGFGWTCSEVDGQKQSIKDIRSKIFTELFENID
jgi:histidine triad (HIT) family protein